MSRAVAAILPGLAVCAAVAAAAMAAGAVEERLLGRAYLDTLVLAILAGIAVRTRWAPPVRFLRGIVFAAVTCLEVAVALLGATISLALLQAVGPALLGGVAAVVTLALLSSYAIGRALRLPPRLAILIASGNSICGNSAIAAVAPVIGASSADVAASVTFTAVLGVLVVLGLPLLAPALDLSQAEYGLVAGLTVYAVPQVLAATAPVGPLAVQVGTLIKLVRVLLLGPLLVLLSIVARRLRAEEAPTAINRWWWRRVVPPFILAFLALVAARSLGLIPEPALGPIASASKALTVLAMAALGLGVDIRTVARVGPQVTAAVTLSLGVLVALALTLAATGLIR